MTTYYVSSQTGNDIYVGTSQSTPLATLQSASNLVKPGDTVEILNGTYTSPQGGDVLDITTSGTASAPITFEAAPGQTPVIDSSGGWNAINIKASYITITGMTVVGDAKVYTLSSALAGYSTGSSSLDGNGIAINTSSATPLPNHIIIENNTVYNEPGGGIYTEGADYIQILNNVVHNNANWSAYGNSGISVSTSANLDSAPGAHIVVSGNLVYGNAQLVPTNGAGTITDGEGIILDTNPNYTSEIQVQNNTVYGNGGSGIESFLTNGAVITGNTVYGNNTQNVQTASNAQIFINQSSNNTVANNDLSNPSLAAPAIIVGSVNTNDSVTLTGTATAGSTVTMRDGGSSPLGIATASGTGAWSFTTTIMAVGSYNFTATDTTSVGTSAASSAFAVTVPTGPANTQPPSAPIVSSGVENSNNRVTVTGTALANSVLNLSCNGGAVATINVGSAGTWSYTSAALLPALYSYTATDTTPGGTSAASNPIYVEFSPTISRAAVNSGHSVTLTGTATSGSWVFVSNGGPTALGRTTSSGTGAWSFTTAALPAGPYAFTATDSSAGVTSAASSAFAVTVPTGPANTQPPSAPIVSSGVENSDNTVTVTGTALANSVLNLSCNGGAVATINVGSAGTWSYTSAALLPALYSYAATDTTSGRTSASSGPMYVEFSPNINGAAVNSDHSVTLTGTATAGVWVDVSDGGSTPLGRTTSSSTGAWSFKTVALQAGLHAFTATDSSAGVTSAPSSPFNTTIYKSSSAPITTATLSMTVPTAAPTITPTFKTITGIPYTGIQLSGTSEPGSLVTILDTAYNTTTILGTTSVSSAGDWSFRSASGFGKIDLSTIHHFTVAAKDSSGNIGSAVGGLYLTDTGNDVLDASSGVPDVFAIMSNLGMDVINGFQTATDVGVNHDYIDFSGRGLTSFSQVQSIMSGSTSTIFTLNGSKTITLAAVAPSMLSAADFRFS